MTVLSPPPGRVPRVRPSRLLLFAAVAAMAIAAPRPARAQMGGAGGGGQVVTESQQQAMDRQRDVVRKSARFMGLQLTDEPLAAVRVEGNSTIPEHTILSLVGSQSGRPAYQDQVTEDVRELMGQRWFRDVRSLIRTNEQGQPVLVFRVDEHPIVGSVTFRGNQKIKTSKLQKECGLVPHRSPFDVNVNRQCVRRIEKMYRDAGFREVAVELRSGDQPDHRDVIFEIIEGDKLAVDSFEFVGNRFVRSAVLKTRLATKPRWFRMIGGTFDPETLEADETALATYYRNLGFFDVEVTAEPLRKRDSGSIRVRYTINEGPRYRIRSVRFEGNEVFSDGELRRPLIATQGRMFRAKDLQKDQQALIDIYDATGRPYTKIDFRRDFTTTAGEFDLVWVIEEDIVRYIGRINIRISGDDPHTRETVARNQISRYVRPGELAHAKDIRRATDALRGSRYWDRANAAKVNVRPVDGDEYMAPALARGQEAATAAASTSRPRSTTAARVGHSVAPAAVPVAAPAPLPSFGTGRRDLDASTSGWLEIMSGPQLPDFAPNDASTGDVAPTVRGQSGGLAGTFADPSGAFVRSQSIDRYGQPVPQSFIPGGSPQGDPFGGTNSGQPPGFVDIDVDLTEARTGRFMFGAGVNSDAGVVGQITLEENNFDLFRPPRSWADFRNGRAFRGGGQSFRIEAAPGAQVSRYLVNWQDPYFLNTDFSFGVSGFYYTRFFEDWTEERLGGRVNVGRIVNQNWSLSTAIRLERVLVRDVFDVPGNPAPDILARAEGRNFLSTARVAAVYDSRDSAFIPTRGFYSELSYEQGFGEFVFPKFDAAATQHWTVYERPDGFGKHTLRLSGKFGYTGDDTPIFERYYAGGFQTFRGFEFRGVSPEIAGRRVGGQFMTLGTLEYMLPITADDNFKAVAFTDFGTVDESVSLDRFRVSVGAGLRVNVPAMGPAPLAFDFAVPLASEDEDDERVFSFYIGLTR